jgi:formylglycine-generating enzyme required for sulfatase activity
MPEARKLNLFISYASQDLDQVRALYRRLTAEPWISVWFDKEVLLPGMDWDLEIYKGLRTADLILVCLSKASVAKEGYVQKEFKRTLSYAEEKPEGTIFVIPVRLDDCQLPLKFQQWQWLDYFDPSAHDKLLRSLKIRAEGLGIQVEALVSAAQPAPAAAKEPAAPPASAALSPSISESELGAFVKINVLGQKPFLIGKYPVTNAQYARFLQADDYAQPQFWLGFPKFDQYCRPDGNWGEFGLNWLREKLKDFASFPLEMWKVEPEYWQDEKFGSGQAYHPVVGISFYEATAYCNWLAAHWRDLPEAAGLTALLLPDTNPQFRLPLETEWLAAAGGEKPEGRYPWDFPGKTTIDLAEIVRRSNVAETKLGRTSPVTQYPLGKSPHGVVDLAGNVWEWQANLDQDGASLRMRGGSWLGTQSDAQVASWSAMSPHGRGSAQGFRIVIAF